MKLLRALLVCACLGPLAGATTFTVSPTGTCPTDIFSVQGAIDSALPNDVVQLAAGEFNFTCATDFGGLTIAKAGFVLSGAPGASIIHGPGVLDPSETIAVFVAANSVTITNISFRDFYFGVFVQAGKGNFTLRNCTFDRVLLSAQVARQGHGAKILNNVFNVPAPPSPDVTSDFGTAFALFVGRQNEYLLVAGNTVTGPGRVANFQQPQDLFAGNTSPIHTAGIWQVDTVVPASTWGRISNNTVTGVDLGIQSSSNFSVVSNNQINNSAIGLAVSNDTDDGATQVTDGIITGNDLRGNEVGLWMASAARNVISFNDVLFNSVVGLLFLNNTNGAPSDTNLFILNQGSKLGVAGNQGTFIRAPKD
ncbi:MAG TPA: hypothetical protein VJA94_16710 [Candidatus Angelobacter sp.]